jgi:hypothetical protein
MGRFVLVGVPALGLAGATIWVVLAAPWLVAHQPSPTPKQPIAFDHRVHVEVVGVDCAFCHRAADQATTAGYPDVELCMACHQVVTGGPSAAEIEKVRQAWIEQRPITWARVHHVPDHSRFPHDAHVQAGVACATCHGDVGRMEQVTQVRSLRMADCVACHQETAAPTQCEACHY